MKAAQWITYRTRFLVKARQLTAQLNFTDALGREHAGARGDYLVEFSDGVLRILSREFFEDVYVPIAADPYQALTGADPVEATGARIAFPKTGATFDKRPPATVGFPLAANAGMPCPAPAFSGSGST